MANKTDMMHTQTHLFASPLVRKSSSDDPRSSHVAEVTETLQKRGWAFLKVSGKSMFPWIREGDIVFLRRARVHEIVRGDVVVFEKNGTMCMHRVLAVRANASQNGDNVSLITKGDATADADSPVSFNDLIGKVEFVYRRNREIRIANGWRRHFGNLLALLSPLFAWSRLFLSKSNYGSARRESPLPHIDRQRSSENSAD